MTTKGLRSRKIAHVPDSLAQEAIDLISAIMRGEVEAKLSQQRAAEKIMTHYATQNRLSPDRLQQLAEKPKASQDVRELAALTDDELNALTTKMMGDALGKPA